MTAGHEPPDYALQLARLAAIVASSDDAIISKTLSGEIQSWNAAAQRLFGYEPDEVIGQSITLIIPPELHDEEREILARLGCGERIEHFETTRVAKDGKRIPISLTVSPIRDSKGVIVGASKIARDISDRKRVEQTLQESARALRDADRRKDEFIALLAHELRNPLAPIRYALATCKRLDRSHPQYKRAEEIIERQVIHMSRLLEDLLDLSRVARGTLELREGVVEISGILGTAVEAARPLLDAKRQILATHMPSEGVRLMADPVRLTQVFSNLLINAAKYTDIGGHIELNTHEEAGEIVVSIRDDGIGISSEMMPRLFTLFAQDRSALGHSEGGLGIGLSLVHGVVQLHGGRIEARSEGPGCGSEFTVRLPRRLPPAGQSALPGDADAPVAGIGLRILLVEDSRDAADSCAAMLELSGHTVQVAYTGRQAIDLAATGAPHVILADIGLPDIDGYELARRIRGLSATAPVLVALTGWGQEQDRERAFAAGFHHHLTKPIAPEAVEALLRSL